MTAGEVTLGSPASAAAAAAADSSNATEQHVWLKFQAVAAAAATESWAVLHLLHASKASKRAQLCILDSRADVPIVLTLMLPERNAL